MDPRATILGNVAQGSVASAWTNRFPRAAAAEGLTTAAPSTPRSHQANNSPTHDVCGSAEESTPRPRRMRRSASVLKKTDKESPEYGRGGTAYEMGRPEEAGQGWKE
jgi:hypothetical protein